jgi:hypothetical protein
VRVRGLVLFLLLPAACNHAGRQAAWELAVEKPRETTSTATTADPRLEAAAETHWRNRDDKREVEQAIAAWEQIVTTDTKNAAALLELARAYYFLADAHLALEPAEDEDLELQTFEKGVNAAEKALLLLDPLFEAKMRADPDQFEEAIAEIGAGAVPAAYWYCANIGRFASRKGLRARLHYRDRVEAAMLRVLELEKQFFHAGPDRFLGGFYAAVPSIAGKSFDKSREHFDRAKKLAPEYLGTWVVEAQYLAIELEDRVMYEEALRVVLSGPDGDDPNIAPENRAAKRTAEKMLKEVEEKF